MKKLPTKKIPHPTIMPSVEIWSRRGVPSYRLPKGESEANVIAREADEIFGQRRGCDLYTQIIRPTVTVCAACEMGDEVEIVPDDDPDEAARGICANCGAEPVETD